MWVQATSKEQLVKDVRFRFYWYDGYSLSDNFAYEAVFVDNDGTSRIDVPGEYYTHVGDIDVHDPKDLVGQYKIWVDEVTPTQYIKDVFDVLMREWEDERLCGSGVAHFVENVLSEAIMDNDSVEDIKRQIVEYVDDRHPGEFTDLLEEIGIESKPVKLTITIENGNNIIFSQNEFIQWMRDHGNERLMNVEVKHV